MGFGLVIRLIDNLQIVTTSNHSVIANSHILQFSTACTKFSQSAVVVWQRFSTAAFTLLWVHEPSPFLKYQLLTATAQNN
jgi:hypothetical protein